MNYKDYNDYEILSYVAEANGEAINVMFDKYKPLIQATANRMYCYCKNTGLEYNDLIQEGMLGLNLAIHTFESNKDTSFYTYAKMCIERKIISIIVSSRRLKHKVLNESISFELSDEYDDEVFNQKCLEDNSFNPESILLKNENEDEMVNSVKALLTDFETQVFELKINGFSYKEISEILDKDQKAIDNALQRIRAKVKDILNKDDKNY